MTVFYNTNFTHNPNAYLTLAIVDAARRLFGDDTIVLADNRMLATIAARGEHEVLICLDGQRLHQGLLRRVRPCFPIMGLWLFEDPFMLDYNVRNAALFDLVFTNDPACVRAYGAKGRYLPLAASTLLHHRPVRKDSGLDYDIFFAGTMWPNRVETIRATIQAFSSLRLKLICPTNEYLPPLPSDLARHAIQWPVSHESFIDFANVSRVTLTLFRNYASHGDIGAATAPGPRLFELGLAGTAQVVEMMPGMNPATFGSNGAIEVVEDSASLIRRTRALLERPALREKCARSAQAEIAAHHTYEQRLAALMHEFGRKDGSRPAAKPKLPQKRLLRVLMCTHSTIHSADWGGVEVYQQTIASLLERDVEVYYWLRRNGHATLSNVSGQVLERFLMADVPWLDSLSDAAEERAFSNVLGHYHFDIVHFQHLGHHTASLPIIAKAAGVGTVFSVHDFFLVCSRYNLLDHQQNFCNIAERSITTCDICLRISENTQAGAQATRRSFMTEVIRSIDCFLFGSAFSYKFIAAIYPEMERHRCAVLGIPSPGERVPSAVSDGPLIMEDAEGNTKPLIVVVLGNFLRSKGGDTVLNLIETANPQFYQFHILGNAQADYAEVLSRWNMANVTYHGRYLPTALDVMAQAHVSLHLSIWPETFCITLSEAWQHKVVPIVTDIGGLSDRVTHGVTGFKVPVGDASAVLNCLELLRSNPDLYRRVRANISPALQIPHAQYAATLLDLYHQVMPERPFGINGLDFDLGQVHLLPHASWRELAPPRHIFDASRRNAVRLELPVSVQDWSHIQGSQFYIDSICDINVEDMEDGAFQPSSTLSIRGWSFTPGVSVAGQIIVALVGDRQIIFFEAQRQDRADLCTIFLHAPTTSGFSADATLRGKWSEGRYQLALVNTLGNRAAFSLTRFQISLEHGVVRSVTENPVRNDEILGSFLRVARSEPYRPLDRQALKWSPRPDLLYSVDQLMGISGLARKLSFEGTEELRIRAWAFQPGASLAGHNHVALVGLTSGSCDLFAGQLEVRADICARSPAAPLCCGFEIAARLPDRIEDQEYAIAIVNAIELKASFQILPMTLTIKLGMIVAVTPDGVPAERLHWIGSVLRQDGSLIAAGKRQAEPERALEPAPKPKPASERAPEPEPEPEPAPKPPVGARKSAIDAIALRAKTKLVVAVPDGEKKARARSKVSS